MPFLLWCLGIWAAIAVVAVLSALVLGQRSDGPEA